MRDLVKIDLHLGQFLIISTQYYQYKIIYYFNNDYLITNFYFNWLNWFDNRIPIFIITKIDLLMNLINILFLFKTYYILNYLSDILKFIILISILKINKHFLYAAVLLSSSSFSISQSWLYSGMFLRINFYRWSLY